MPDRVRKLLGRHIAPPRFVAFIVLLPLAFILHQSLSASARWTDSAALAFDVAATVFLISLWPLVRKSDAAAMRDHSDAYDANRLLMLVMTTVITIAVMVAIAGELPGAKHGAMGSIVRLVGTLLLIWLFANTVYALHYAHEYYSSPEDSEGDSGGLAFPGGVEPTYGDFLYFSFTLGMTFQTSDVDVTRRRIRTVVLLHSFGAFVFNLGVIAFTINALGAG